MPARSSIICGTVLSILSLAIAVRPEQKPGTDVGNEDHQSGASSKTQAEIVIHSAVRLVQVSVVVEDKQHHPVTDLKQQDFVLFDQGKPQKLAFFSAAPAQHVSPVPVRRLPRNVFTNRYDLKGEDTPSSVTMVLFDALNTSPQDQEYVRKEVIRFLKELKPQDHVAVYGLTTQLLILHEFTRDSADLVAAAQKFSPKELAAYDAAHTPNIDLLSLGSDPQWIRLQNSVNNAQAQIADQQNINRVGITLSAMNAIVDHVAGIPGRKNLVWISGGFPIQLTLPTIGVPTSASSEPGDTSSANRLRRADRQTGTFDNVVRGAAESLNRANIAIYAIDAKGVELDPTMDVSSRGPRLSQPVRGTAVFGAEQDTRGSSKLLADRTGGLAFFGNNDIREAMRRAFDDGRFAYNIGFYPDHGEWSGKFRKIKIQVKGEGLKVRYRQGYYAVNNNSDSDAVVAADLRQTADSPLDATSVSLIISGKSVGNGDPHTLELHIGVDPKQLLLEQSGDHRKGGVDLLFVQSEASGKRVAAEKQHVDIDLETKQYEHMSAAAMVLGRHLIVSPGATDLRVIVRDAGSGSLGSVTLPITALLQTGADDTTPKQAH
jgi:VWFA-related protein